MTSKILRSCADIAFDRKWLILGLMLLTGITWGENTSPESVPELTAKFWTTRISVVRGKFCDYIQGKVELSVRSQLKYFKKPLLRVVFLTEENGNRFIRDCILSEPNPIPNTFIDHDHTIKGKESIEKKSATQSEVAKEKYDKVKYLGYTLGSVSSAKVGYALLGKQNKVQLIGYRLEFWYDGTCISTFDTFRPAQLSKLQIPDDWHIMFKYPEKFKYPNDQNF